MNPHDLAAVLPFAGLRPELETFIERVEPRDFAAASDRWKQMRLEGWDLELLGADDGGQCDHVIALGCRYLSATRGAEASVA